MNENQLQMFEFCWRVCKMFEYNTKNLNNLYQHENIVQCLVVDFVKVKEKC